MTPEHMNELIERLEKIADYYDPLLHDLAEHTHVGLCDLLRSAAAALRRLTHKGEVK